MAIANIIARGIGFNPGSVKFIPTHGFGAGAVVPVPDAPRTTGGGGMDLPPFRPDREREEREAREYRHLRRTVEIAATGRVVSPDLMLDESEQAQQQKALAVVIIGLLQ